MAGTIEKLKTTRTDCQTYILDDDERMEFDDDLPPVDYKKPSKQNENNFTKNIINQLQPFQERKS